MCKTVNITQATCTLRTFSVVEGICKHTVDASTLKDKQGRYKFHLDLISDKPK